MSFSNPIVGGTALIRQAIKSPNYVPGSVGWTINRDGTAEFSGATIRGDLELGPVAGAHMLFTGDNIPAELQTFFTNQGTPVAAVVLTYGPNGTDYYFQADVENGGLPVAIYTGFTVSGNVFVQTFTQCSAVGSPVAIGFGNNIGETSQYTFGDSEDINFTNFVQIGKSHDFVLTTGSLDISQPRGCLGQVAATSNSSAVTGEAVVLTLPSIDFPDGWAYKFKFGGQIQSSANNITTFRIRRTNAVGTLILGGFQYDAVSGSNREREGENVAVNTSGATITFAPVLTMQASTGNSTQVGATNLPRWFEVWVCGRATNFTNRPSV